MKKFLLILLIVIIIVVVAIILILGYLGFVPGVSTLFGSDKPRDLGVTWTPEDYQAVNAKTAIEIKTATGDVTPSQSIKLSTTTHPANITLSSNELTAAINNNQNNWKYFPVSNVQVKINTDGSAQMSGMLNLGRLAGYAAATGASYGDIKTVMDKFQLLPQTIPFFVSATPSISNNAATMNIGKAELGRIPIPQDLVNNNDSAINGFFTQQINAFPGFSTKSANFAGGKLNFDGILHDSIETYK
jgi:hypothetical protein